MNSRKQMLRIIKRRKKRKTEWRRKARYLRRLRIQLIEKLGGQCAVCGDREDLEFDHIDPKTKRYSSHKLSWAQRLFRYRKEIAEGKIQLLCADHNRCKGFKSMARYRELLGIPF